MSVSALAQLILDQGLRGARRVKRCSHAVSSSARFWPSIHPQASAASRAVAYVSVLLLACFFGMRRKTPADRSWFARSHASHAPAFGSSRIESLSLDSVWAGSALEFLVLRMGQPLAAFLT